jgi:hypothetical protein
MRRASNRIPESAEKTVRDIRRATRRHHSAEEKIRTVLEGLRSLITSPAFILMKAADSFTNPTTAPNQLWQTDFTYLKVIGWGWFYLSTVLDDFSRYILAWKLCTTMAATDVSDTLQAALQASGLDKCGRSLLSKAKQRCGVGTSRRPAARAVPRIGAAEHSEFLRDADVVILPDNDQRGRKHRDIAKVVANQHPRA